MTGTFTSGRGGVLMDVYDICARYTGGRAHRLLVEHRDAYGRASFTLLKARIPLTN